MDRGASLDVRLMSVPGGSSSLSREQRGDQHHHHYSGGSVLPLEDEDGHHGRDVDDASFSDPGSSSGGGSDHVEDGPLFPRDNDPGPSQLPLDVRMVRQSRRRSSLSSLDSMEAEVETYVSADAQASGSRPREEQISSNVRPHREEEGGEEEDHHNRDPHHQSSSPLVASDVEDHFNDDERPVTHIPSQLSPHHHHHDGRYVDDPEEDPQHPSLPSSSSTTVQRSTSQHYQTLQPAQSTEHSDMTITSHSGHSYRRDGSTQHAADERAEERGGVESLSSYHRTQSDGHAISPDYSHEELPSRVSQPDRDESVDSALRLLPNSNPYLDFPSTSRTTFVDTSAMFIPFYSDLWAERRETEVSPTDSRGDLINPIFGDRSHDLTVHSGSSRQPASTSTITSQRRRQQRIYDSGDRFDHVNDALPLLMPPASSSSSHSALQHYQYLQSVPQSETHREILERQSYVDCDEEEDSENFEEDLQATEDEDEGMRGVDQLGEQQHRSSSVPDPPVVNVCIASLPEHHLQPQEDSAPGRLVTASTPGHLVTSSISSATSSLDQLPAVVVPRSHSRIQRQSFGGTLEPAIVDLRSPQGGAGDTRALSSGPIDLPPLGHRAPFNSTLSSYDSASQRTDSELISYVREQLEGGEALVYEFPLFFYELVQKQDNERHNEDGGESYCPGETDGGEGDVLYLADPNSVRDSTAVNQPYLNTGQGSMALCNVLRLLGLKYEPYYVARRVPTRECHNVAPLPEYLFSRAVAGTTHQDLIQGAELVSKGEVTGRFFPFFPARNVCLRHWLIYWMKKGAVPLLTLNLQRLPRGHSPCGGGDVFSSFNTTGSSRLNGNGQDRLVDGWQHFAVYAVDKYHIHIASPQKSVNFGEVAHHLCSPSELCVRCDDVCSRYDDDADLRLLADGHENSRWVDLNVLGQVVSLLRERFRLEALASTTYENVASSTQPIERMYTSPLTTHYQQLGGTVQPASSPFPLLPQSLPQSSHMNHVIIPAVHQAGVTLFVRTSTPCYQLLCVEPELPPCCKVKPPFYS